jgi:hypothetical protein
MLNVLLCLFVNTSVLIHVDTQNSFHPLLKVHFEPEQQQISFVKELSARKKGVKRAEWI